jgi:folylpolyglutamate synthase
MNLDAIPEMLEWTRKAGYDVGDFAKRGLKCIHVAGTKGKGSVCVMVENILLQYRRNDDGALGGIGYDKALGKIGLYTSPHLVSVRERIRIDGAPLSESMFTHYFFELWDRFSIATISNTSDTNSLSLDARPSYFRYLTLLAFHTFIKEGVETAIVECGIGGEYDSTNILPAEAVTVSAITRLGIDHVGMLGDTIENIAWHKGGIMKRGVPAYTIEQVPEAKAALANCAAAKGADLHIIKRIPSLESSDMKLSLGGDFQKENASLAIAVAISHLQNMGITEGVSSFEEVLMLEDKFSPQFKKGLETAKWPGRWEVRREGNIEWLIDGAHTPESIEATAHWYLSKLEDALIEENPPTATMLIFNQQDRDASSLIRKLLTVLGGKGPTTSSQLFEAQSYLDTMRFSAYIKMFTYAAFCTNIPFKSQVPEVLDLRHQEEAAKVYESLASNTLNVCYGSVDEAVELARRVAEGDERVLVLVTGSLYLVGALMKVLERDATNPAERRLDQTLPRQTVIRPQKLHDVKRKIYRWL